MDAAQRLAEESALLAQLVEPTRTPLAELYHRAEAQRAAATEAYESARAAILRLAMLCPEYQRLVSA